MEFPFIHSHQEIYLGGKIALLTWLAVLLFYTRNLPNKMIINLQIGIVMVLYCIHGQFYSPRYMFVYHELIIAFAFFFPLPKQVFNSFALIGGALYLAMMWWRYETVQSWLDQNSRIMWLMSGITITVFAILLHYFFTAERHQKEEVIRKFGLVGVQTATVIHDVKSMISTPYLNVGMLKVMLEKNNDKEVNDLIQDIENQLERISSTMIGLNQVVGLKKQEKENLDILSVINEVASTLSLKTRGIQLDLECEAEIFAEKALVKSIVFNILMNSIQSFRSRQIKNPQVKIYCLHPSLQTLQVVFSDNAGGFRPELLKILSGEETEKEHSSGMGLFLISTGMRSLGGKAEFTNTDKGAQITLTFLSRSHRKLG